MRRVACGLALVTLAACSGSAGSTSTGGAAGDQTAATGSERHGTAIASSNMPTSPAPEAASGSPAPVTPAVPVSVVAGTSTPIPEGLHPRVQIVAPRDGSLSRTNRVEVRLRVTDWPAPQDMRHIHLIVDNDPYIRVDDPSQPRALENLSEGTHVLRAFPGWSTHESVKTEGAFAMVVFHVGNRTDALHLDPHAPLLTYSRPKGEYNGAEADHVLLDFYIANIPGNQLSATGHRVRYAIDGGTPGEITSWVPHFIDHLADGEHHVTLDLLGPNGQPAPGPFNHTERVIRVNHTPSGSPAPHAH